MMDKLEPNEIRIVKNWVNSNHYFGRVIVSDIADRLLRERTRVSEKV